MLRCHHVGDNETISDVRLDGRCEMQTYHHPLPSVDFTPLPMQLIRNYSFLVPLRSGG